MDSPSQSNITTPSSTAAPGIDVSQLAPFLGMLNNIPLPLPSLPLSSLSSSSSHSPILLVYFYLTQNTCGTYAFEQPHCYATNGVNASVSCVYLLLFPLFLFIPQLSLFPLLFFWESTSPRLIWDYFFFLFSLLLFLSSPDDLSNYSLC